MNTQYAVFFAAIVTLFFFIDAKSAPTLRLAIPNDRLLLVSMLVLYYIFDWFTANVMPIGAPYRLVELFCYVLSVVFLGIVTIWMNSESVGRFLLFGLYGLGAGVWDLYVLHRTINHFEDRERKAPVEITALIGLVLGAQRLCLALTLAVVSAVVLVYGSGQTYCATLSTWLIGAIVLLKLARLLYFAAR